VRKGGPKPDISSADALKRALVAAKAIVVNDPATGSPVSTHLFAIFEREGIAAEMKAKAKLAADNNANFDAVAKGEVDFGFTQSNLIGEEPRLELVGSPPAPYGNSTVFVAGLVASSKEPAAGKALITYLSSSAAASVFRAKGLSLN
jgi:molybdate transport system substrate-binding protein